MKKSRNTSTLYLVDVGIILPPFHREYRAYNQVYDRKNALYDEHQYFMADKNEAIKAAREYVEQGMKMTYGIVSEQTGFSDNLTDEEISELEVSGSDYSTCIYSIKKDVKDGKIAIIEDFVDCNEPKLKRFNVTIRCLACYNSYVDVPKDYTVEMAIKYAQEHMAELPLGELEYVKDSDSLDEENCDFEE